MNTTEQLVAIAAYLVDQNEKLRAQCEEFRQQIEELEVGQREWIKERAELLKAHKDEIETIRQYGIDYKQDAGYIFDAEHGLVGMKGMPSYEADRIAHGWPGKAPQKESNEI